LIQIRTERLIPAKKWQILRFIMRVQDFPTIMPNVKECRVLKKYFRSAITEWHVLMDGLELRWKQEDEIDTTKFEIRFRAIEGDLAHFQGRWMLSETKGGSTQVSVEVTAKIGIPMVEDVIESVIGARIQKNFDSMLEVIAEELTKRSYQNRRSAQPCGLRGFAVIGHPYNLAHLVQYFRHYNPDFQMPSQEFLRTLFDLAPAYASYTLHHYRSKTGKSTQGYFIMCPIIPDTLKLDPQRVIEKVIQSCKVAEKMGVGIATLGGFASIAAERFADQLEKTVHIPLTTGNTFTVAMVVDGIKKAAKLMGLDLARAKVTIIGGTGDIGSACARILCREVSELTLTGRNELNLVVAQKMLTVLGKAGVFTSTNNNDAVKERDIVIAAASSTGTIVDIKAFKSGAIISDVGYPKNISYSLAKRDDILVFSGGICSVPSPFNVGFNIGLPSRDVLYGCFAEAAILEFERIYENYSWGRGHITPEKVDEIRQIGQKHGFELAPFFWGNRLITKEEIQEIRSRSA